MYQLLHDTVYGKSQCVYRLLDSALIPFDTGNVDYIAFKEQISSKPEHLLDSYGNVMSAEAVANFLTQIP